MPYHASPLQQLQIAKRLRQAINHRLQRAQASSFGARLLLFFGLNTTLITTGALVYHVVSPGSTWGQSLFTVYAVLYRAPGVVVTREATLGAALVLNLLFLFGVFVFAALLGLASDAVKAGLRELRAGGAPLHLANHVVLLHYAPELSLPLLRQLAAAHADPSSARFYRTPVALLADAPKAGVDAAVEDALRSAPLLELYVRSGRPQRPGDLRRVCAGAAATVVLQHPPAAAHGASAEALKAAALVALLSLRGEGSGGSEAACEQRVVAQVPAEAAASGVDCVACVQAAAPLPARLRLVRALDRSLIDGLAAQTAVQPGVASVLRELLRCGAGSSALRWCDAPIVSGSAVDFGTLRRCFGDAVLLGVAPGGVGEAVGGSEGGGGGGGLLLSPPDALRVGEGDVLLALTRAPTLWPTTAVPVQQQQQLETSSPAPPPPLFAPPRRASLGGGVLRALSRACSTASGDLASDRGSLRGGGGHPHHLGARPLSPLGAAAPEDADDGDNGGAATTSSSQQPLRVIVAGWPVSELRALLDGLRAFAPPRSTVVAVVEDAAAAAAVLGIHNNSSDGAVELVSARLPTSADALLRAGLEAADALVLGAQSALPHTEADAAVVAALLAVQGALRGGGGHGSSSGGGASPRSPHQPLLLNHHNHRSSGGSPLRGVNGGGGGPNNNNSHHRPNNSRANCRRLHVVARMHSYGARRAAQDFLSSAPLAFSYELLIADEYAAAALVQTAEEPRFALALRSLLAADGGAGLHVAPAAAFGVAPGVRASFASVQDAVRRRGPYVALGYRRANGRALLAPAAGDDVVLQRGDALVVLAGRATVAGGAAAVLTPPLGGIRNRGGGGGTGGGAEAAAAALLTHRAPLAAPARS